MTDQPKAAGHEFEPLNEQKLIEAKEYLRKSNFDNIVLSILWNQR